MKKIILSLMFSMVAYAGANAMSFSRAQAEALYLTDKMAYELNLNDQQYNDAYEINLDYFLRIDSPSDLYGCYYDYRLNDLRCILHDWQYSLLFATDYFLRPIAWRAGSWFFPIYSYYNRNYFYYSRPSVWVSYRGGHSRFYHHAGFYTHRRPVWNGGLRGHDMHRPSAGVHHSSHGRGYHIDMRGHRPGSSRGHIGSNHGSMNPGNNHGYNRGSSYGNMGSSSNHGSMNPGNNHSFNRSSSHGSMNPGNNHGYNRGSSHGSMGSGNSHGSMNPGNNHSFNRRSSHGSVGSSSSHGSMGRGSSHGSMNRGNSFDRSSSRMSGGRGREHSMGSRGGGRR